MSTEAFAGLGETSRRELPLEAQATAGGGDPHVAFRRPSEEYPHGVLPTSTALWSAPDLWRAGLDVEAHKLTDFFGCVRVTQYSRIHSRYAAYDVRSLQLWALVSDEEGDRLLVEWLQSEFVHTGHGDSKEVFARAWLNVSPDQLVELRSYIDEQWPIACANRERKHEQTAKQEAWNRFLASRGLDETTLRRSVIETLREHGLDRESVERRRQEALRKAGLTERQIALKFNRVLRESGLDQNSRRINRAQAWQDFEAQYEPKS